jgi:uncharacterized protein YodC (DUF2158 family)
MTNITIEEGDYVRHKNPLINGGLQMTVEDVKDDQAQCSHFGGVELVHKTDWFPFEELEIVTKADGGFIE